MLSDMENDRNFEILGKRFRKDKVKQYKQWIYGSITINLLTSFDVVRSMRHSSLNFQIVSQIKTDVKKNECIEVGKLPAN